MLLSKVFSPSRIKIGLESEGKDELFEELVDILAKEGGRGYPRDRVLEAVRERERRMSTGIARGVAVPHGQAEGIAELSGVLGVSKKGIEYESLDGQPVHLVFLLVSSMAECELHLAALKRVAIMLGDPEFYAQLVKADSSERASAIIGNFEVRLIDLHSGQG